MRNLNREEITSVSGGELVCSISTTMIGCTGTVEDWSDAIFGAYDNAVESFTDFFMWVDNTLTGG